MKSQIRVYLVQLWFFLFFAFSLGAFAESTPAEQKANQEMPVHTSAQAEPTQAEPVAQAEPSLPLGETAKSLSLAHPLEQPNLSQPNIHYGEIFMEESQRITLFPFELSVSGGGELASPYINSSFFSVEIKHRINSFGQVGLEYAIHSSRPASPLTALRKEMALYGFEMSYLFLQQTAYINWHYTFFQSHINLAGLLRINMTVPLQLGVGVMELERKNTRLAVKWGAGPRVYLSRRWAVQLLLSQSVSLKRARFLYTWYSFKFIYGL